MAETTEMPGRRRAGAGETARTPPDPAKTRRRAAVCRESAAARAAPRTRARNARTRQGTARRYTLRFLGGMVTLRAVGARGAKRAQGARRALGVYARTLANPRRCGAAVCICSGECGLVYARAVRASRVWGLPEPRMYPPSFSKKVVTWIEERA